MNAPVLRLRDFTVCFGERIVLAGVNLDIHPGEVLTLMGPGGAGKSTLLRTICGLNDAHSTIEIGGSVNYLGQPIKGDRRPPLVEQSPTVMMTSCFEFLASAHRDRSAFTRRQLRSLLADYLQELEVEQLVEKLDRQLLDLHLGERRLLLLARALLQKPPLLCVDEPTARLEASAANEVLQLLERQRREMPILMVSHNQRHARRLGTHSALLAGGKICEHRPTEDFFEDPQTREAAEFVGTGSCTVASPDACPEELDPRYLQRSSSVPSPGSGKRIAPSARRGPFGFHWMRPGQLAGTPMPGGIRSIEADLEALRRVDVTVLITLTLDPLPVALLERFGIESMHFPIVDMKTPTLEAAADLCTAVQQRLQAGEVIAFHCKAGIGRTGTMLAAFEIWEGMSAVEAFKAARKVCRRWIQSDEQRQFLSQFEHWLE